MKYSWIVFVGPDGKLRAEKDTHSGEYETLLKKYKVYASIYCDTAKEAINYVEDLIDT